MEATMTVLERITEVRNKLAEGLRNLGFTGQFGEKISENGVPCTTNGVSFYIYARHPRFSDLFKFRISDHVCGDYRSMTEVCVYDSSDLEKVLFGYETQLFPDRFNFIYETVDCFEWLSVKNLNIPSNYVKDGDAVTVENCNFHGQKVGKNPQTFQKYTFAYTKLSKIERV